MGHLIHQQFRLAGLIPRLRIYLLYRNVFRIVCRDNTKIRRKNIQLDTADGGWKNVAKSVKSRHLKPSLHAAMAGFENTFVVKFAARFQGTAAADFQNQ